MTNGTSACFSLHRTVSQKEEVVYLSFECGNLLVLIDLQWTREVMLLPFLSTFWEMVTRWNLIVLLKCHNSHFLLLCPYWQPWMIYSKWELGMRLCICFLSVKCVMGSWFNMHEKIMGRFNQMVDCLCFCAYLMWWRARMFPCQLRWRKLWTCVCLSIPSWGPTL